MIKEALEYIVGLKQADVVEVENRKFIRRDLSPLNVPEQKTMHLHSLDGLVDFIKAEYNKNDYGLIQVNDFNAVCLFGGVFGVEKQRTQFAYAEAILPFFNFGRKMDMESFIIGVQANFVQTENRDKLVKLASAIQFDDTQSVVDNGISQTVTAKTGVAKLENIKLPNPVALKPYRTFMEIDQPKSDFIFRIDKNGGFGLYEADGGAWKRKAMKNIQTYLEKELLDYTNIKVIA